MNTQQKTLADLKVGDTFVEIQPFNTHPLPNQWVEGWNDGYRFQALVFKHPSQYGINEGRVSKLCVVKGSWTKDWRELEPAFNYDRGWDVLPRNDEERAVLETILSMYPNEL